MLILLHLKDKTNFERENYGTIQIKQGDVRNLKYAC